MATIKSYTSLEQSFNLVKILPLESADMYYDRYGTPNFIDDIVTHKSIKTDKYQHLIPCWSLAALLGVLPKKFNYNFHTYQFIYNTNAMFYINIDTYDEDTFCSTNENLVDACYEMILKLHKLNLL